MGQEKNRKERCVAVILAVLIFLVNIRNIAGLEGPIMFEDEMGYLGNAATLAGKNWNGIMRGAPYYSFGWSIALVPLFWIFSTMSSLYKAVNILNAGVLVAIFFIWRSIFQDYFKDRSALFVTAVSACICFYPGLLIQSSFAMAEIWCAFIFSLLTLCLYRFIQAPSSPKAAVFGGLLYYLYVCHNRMLATIIAGVMIMAAMWCTHAIDWKKAAAFLGALALAWLAFGALRSYIAAIHWSGALPVGNDLQAGLTGVRSGWTLEKIKNFCKLIGTFFFSNSIGTCGLAPFGMFVCFYKIFQAVRKKQIGRVFVEMWLLLAFLGQFAVATLVRFGTDYSAMSLYHVFYTRYFELTTIPLMGYGALCLPGLCAHKKGKEIYNLCYALLILRTGLLGFEIAKDQIQSNFMVRPNAPGLGYFFVRYGDNAGSVLAAALFGIVGWYLLTFLFSGKSMGRYIGLLAAAGLGLMSAFAMDADVLNAQRYRAAEMPIIQQVQNISPDVPVYTACRQSFNSYFQAVLMDIPLQRLYEPDLQTIQDKNYYLIISNQILAEQDFDAAGYTTVAQAPANTLLYKGG